MSISSLWTRSLYIIAIVCTVVFSVTLFSWNQILLDHSSFLANTPSTARGSGTIDVQASQRIYPIQNTPVETGAIVWLPKRIKIPKIRVDTLLEHVGLTPEGAMDIPKNEDNAAWLELGPRPGEIGNAIIDGHYGVWENGKVSIFNNLHTLSTGDPIYIEDEKGNIITFLVRELRIYPESNTVPEIFISKDKKSHLNLITCEWIWDSERKDYPNRLVVFADLFR